MFITQNELKMPNEDVKDNVMLLTFRFESLFVFVMHILLDYP